jgi:ubiquinone/menaquinone biosynthesis C-methylase UbiE
VVARVTAPGRLVAESYDRAAAEFAGAADRHVYRLLAAPLAAAVTREADVGAGRVLDVAAGTGAVGRRFARTVATDVSLEQLRHNPARCRVRADGRHLPFRDRCFAAAVCGFGVNHVADPAALVAEMARVSPIVGVSTWQRPEPPYAPKQAVYDVLARRAGNARSAAGVLLDQYTAAVGSVDAVDRLLRTNGLRGDVQVVQVEVPWPGIDAYLDYRLSMPSSARVLDDALLRTELHEALASLPTETLTWRPEIIVGVGRS